MKTDIFHAHFSYEKKITLVYTYTIPELDTLEVDLWIVPQLYIHWRSSTLQ